jgi:cephalosporin-C deacetylase-like acetyl esterase
VPAKGRPRAGLVVLHGYANVPTLEQSSRDWAPMAQRGLAVLIIRVRGYPGSRADAGYLADPVAGLRDWITHGLDTPISDRGFGSEWSLSFAAADAMNAHRALRAFLGAAPIFMHGESLGAALAILAASQLADIDEPARLALALPSMGDWPWRLARPEGERTGGAGELIRRFIADFRELESDISNTLRVFDTVIHARRIHCPVLCKLALRDEVVPAPTAAAVFNALGSDTGLKWRYVVRYGHFDGGIADMRRHALFDRLMMDFLDPSIDPRSREWCDSSARPAEPCPAPASDGQPSLFGPGPLVRQDADEALIAAYVSTGRTLDDLPYTPEFERLHRAMQDAVKGAEGREGGLGNGRSEREVFHKLHNLRKAGKLPRLGKPAGKPPRLPEADEAALSALVIDAVGSLGQRDQLPYSDRFAPLVVAFNERTGRSLSPHDVWRLVAKLAK